MVSDNNLQNRDNEISIKNLASSSTNPINESILNIELEERKLALLERQVKLRKEAAEAEAIELKNKQLKINLGLIS